MQWSKKTIAAALAWGMRGSDAAGARRYGRYEGFMQKTSAIKVKPESWKDLFFPNVHALPGS